MKVLITGASGQLGRALPPELTRHSVVALERARLDITKLEEVRAAVAAHHPDVVINAAAYNLVDAAESDPASAYRLNALGPRNLAVATAEQGTALLHVSTDYVFDGMGNRPLHEFDRVNPQSVYGLSKHAGEAAVIALNRRHYVARTAWLYHPAGKNFPNTMLALAQQRRKVQVVNDQHGSPTYAPHLAQAIAQLIETEAYGIYHLAGRGGTTWYELTRELYRRLQIDIAVQPVTTAEFPRPAKRPGYSILTTLQEPQILLPPWEEGVAEFAEQKTFGQDYSGLQLRAT